MAHCGKGKNPLSSRYGIASLSSGMGQDVSAIRRHCNWTWSNGQCDRLSTCASRTESAGLGAVRHSALSRFFSWIQPRPYGSHVMSMPPHVPLFRRAYQLLAGAGDAVRRPAAPYNGVESTRALPTVRFSWDLSRHAVSTGSRMRS